MNTTSRKYYVSVTLAIVSLTCVTALADFGSKHRDQHRRDRSSTPIQTPAAPVNLAEISETVGAMHLGSIEQELGGHVSQVHLEGLAPIDAFIEAFEAGDALFEIKYNALDGVGVNVGNGKRFSSVPRLDLDGSDAWASVLPHRMTGPNGDSCLACHNDPVSDGAGDVNNNTVRIDPDRIQQGFIERQTPHIFGMGGVQLLAEEMTTELQKLRDAAVETSCRSNVGRSVKLTAKGIDFGSILVNCNKIDYGSLRGIDKDLVVKPFEWKGLTAFVRDFVRGASHQELGMQAIELVGHIDSDYDGVSNELAVGDITALAIYSAGQQRPVSKLELVEVADSLSDEELRRYGLPLNEYQTSSIERGETLFNDMRCASCHIPSLTVETPIFSEPSRHPDYRDTVFPAGENVEMPNIAIEFDITRDIFVNEIELPNGQTLGEFERNSSGGAVVRLYGDLKRHDMGPAMAEEIDEGNVGASVFLTENLWGVGSTAPYLHDGRATTMTEAILYHGGEASGSRNLFQSASEADKADLMAFLDSLVLYLEE